MERKGFPESYDTGTLLRFLADIKAGKRNVAAPLYSHLVYDVVPGEETVVDRPDILIVEGLNVLQPARLPKDGTAIPFVSDFFDFSVYLDADEDDLQRWYVEPLPEAAPDRLPRPALLFPQICRALAKQEAIEIADGLWTRINLVEPAREHRADPPAREPDPAQGAEPPHRAGRAAAALVERVSGRLAH